MSSIFNILQHIYTDTTSGSQYYCILKALTVNIMSFAMYKTSKQAQSVNASRG